MHGITLGCAVLALACAGANGAAPNFIVIETDDQDYVLGSLSVMSSVQKHLIDAGTLFSHSVVTTPICCPSRTSMWTSRYAHNLDDQTLGWCGTYPSSENLTWVMDLKQNGYTTFLGGKYHNDYAAFCEAKVHMPPQFDALFAFCVDSKYFNITYNENGKMITTGDAPSDYMTSQIGNHSVAWIETAAKAAAGGGAPFFAYIGTHAPHVPATVAPWYDHTPLPAEVAPRTPNWNLASPDKHFPVNYQPDMLADGLANASDAHFQRRLRSLLSVDDILAAVIETLNTAGVLDNTYVIYTSDHGYNLGTFRLPAEKFHVYENDLRVPLIIRGPGVPANATNNGLVANIDLGETILDLAGLPGRADADGRSYKRLAFGQGSLPMSDTLYSALHAPPGEAATTVLLDSSPSAPPIAGWRDRILIEYWSMGDVWRGPCSNFSGPCHGGLEALCDAPPNTYVALRVRNATMNAVYAEFRDRPEAPYPSATNWTELYDMGAGDAYQIVNQWANGGVSPSLLHDWQRMLWAVVNCTGAANCP